MLRNSDVRFLIMGKISAKLSELGLMLPIPAKPVANYVPWVISGSLVFVAGQLPLEGGKPKFVGQVGAALSMEDGAAAARLCAMNLLAQLNDACSGDLERITRIVKLLGFVNCGPDFTDISKVMNGASDLFALLFGEAGKHARSSVGVTSLPLGVAVEIEVIAEIMI